MFKRILIANRGEIACRIARTCKKLGIEYVAVYSQADSNALHLQDAAATVCLGGSAAVDSYLRGETIIDAAIQQGCQAVHPGYGFLSENAEFAQAVVDAGLVFIGPAPETISLLGDKSRAKGLMKHAGVPTIPGTVEASDDAVLVQERVRGIGLPVLLKPSAGGGGKGMQVVRSLESLYETIESAIRVARNSFGDGRLIVERFIERPRHVEVQIFGDRFGHVVHLFERECSLQRRHQKVIEEAPASCLPKQIRQRLHDAAVRGARSINYLNAGTFEFIVDDRGNFYFLEVNTRLQVEHPVTEKITGIDLVEWQLRVAAGEPLPLTQNDIRATGVAIEARVYAEDPWRDFSPAPGRVAAVVWPANVRIETAINSGSDVPPFYDPMVAKLVTHDCSRREAIAQMQKALRCTFLLGLTTNLGFLAQVLDDPLVQKGEVHTQYLDDISLVGRERTTDVTAVACAAALMSMPSNSTSFPWYGWSCLSVLDRVALSQIAPLGSVNFWAGDRMFCASLRSHDSGSSLRVGVSGQEFVVTISFEKYAVISGTVDGKVWASYDSGEALEFQIGGNYLRVQTLAMHRPDELIGEGSAVAPMPGVLTALPVMVGSLVREGDVLAIVEAMKMENSVTALTDGIVTAIHYALGDNVKAGDILVEVGLQG